MSDLIQFGIYFEEFIKAAARLLATDGWAGLICWILLLFLILLSGWYLWLVFRGAGVNRVGYLSHIG